MAKVRSYEFTTGFETSTIPDPGTPSAANDSISLGYLEDESYWGAPVASYAAMRSLDTDQRRDRQVRVVDTGGGELWIYDSANTSVDDGTTVLKPDDLGGGDPGRWLVVSAGGGGGGGGSGSSIDQVIQKIEMERAGIYTKDVDNMLATGGGYKPDQKFYEGNLMRNYSSGASTVEVVWNAKYVVSGDPNYDSSTSWSATGAAASVGTTSTAGQFVVGTSAIKFDKNGTATEAAVRYDIGSQSLGLASNTEAWFYMYLPSVTGLTNIVLRIYADSTSNYRTFTATSQFDTSAFAVGLNLIKIDLSTGGTNSGTGWAFASQLVRYVEVGVTTSSAGQTYTGVAFDALYFSYRYPNRINVIGSEFSLFDNSIRQEVLIDAANTAHSGRLTLNASFASNVAGGLSGTSRGRILRSTMLMNGDDIIIMDNDSGLSGTVTTTQDMRIGVKFRESESGDYPVIIDALDTQRYETTAVGGSTIDVSDPVNTIANLKNGDAVDIFRPQWIDHRAYYKHIASRSLTADATHSSGTTTLTVTTTSLAVGDIVCKRHLSHASLSVVAENGNEAFTSLSLDTDPNGVQLIDTGLSYPNRESVWSHWALGASTNAEAVRNRFGTSGLGLTANGSLNLQDEFLKGRNSASGYSASNYFSLTSSETEAISGDPADTALLQLSFWTYRTGETSVDRPIVMRFSAGNGWNLYFKGSAATFAVATQGTDRVTMTSVPTNQWVHHFVVLNSSGTNCIAYLNGTPTARFASSISDPGTQFRIGSTTGSDFFNGKVADLVIWRNGTELSQSQVQQIYNGGFYRSIGLSGVQRYKYTASGLSGQKATLKVRATRTTTAVRPAFDFVGTIKT